MEGINPVQNNGSIQYFKGRLTDLYGLIKPCINAKEKISNASKQKTLAKESYKEGNRGVTFFSLLELGQSLPAALLAAGAAYAGAVKLFNIQGAFQPNLKLLPMIQTGSLALSLAYRNRESSTFLAKWDRSKPLQEQLQYLEETLGSGAVSKKEAEIATSPKIIKRLVTVLDEKEGPAEDLEKKLNELHRKAQREVLLNRLDLTSTGSLIIGGVIEITAPQFASVVAIASALPTFIKRTKGVLPEVEEAVSEKPEKWSDSEANVMKQRKTNLYRADLALFATFLASQALGATHIEKLVAVGGLLGGAEATLGIGRTMYNMEIDRMLFDRKALKDKGKDPIENGLKRVKEYGSSVRTWIKSKVSRE